MLGVVLDVTFYVLLVAAVVGMGVVVPLVIRDVRQDRAPRGVPAAAEEDQPKKTSASA